MARGSSEVKATDLGKANKWLAKEVERIPFGPRLIELPTQLDPEPRVDGKGATWKLHVGEKTIALPKRANFSEGHAVAASGDEALVATSEDAVLHVALATKKVTSIQTGHVGATAILMVGTDHFLLATPGLSFPCLELRRLDQKTPIAQRMSPVVSALAAITGGTLVWILEHLDGEQHPAIKAPTTRLSIVHVSGGFHPYITFYLPGLDYRFARRAGRTLVVGRGHAYELGEDAAVNAAYKTRNRKRR